MNLFEGVEDAGTTVVSSGGAAGSGGSAAGGAGKAKSFPRTGVAYVAGIEHEYLNSHKLSICANCMALGLSKPLKRCAGCGLVDYCGRECQKAQWKTHKPFCNMTQGKGRKDAYLTAQTVEMTQRLLVDAYRLRVEVDHADGDCDHGIYYNKEGTSKFAKDVIWARDDVYADFQLWLDLAEDSDILPDWWRHEERMETLALAFDKSAEQSVWKSLDQTELITRYEGDTSVRSAMLILAELVVGYEGKGWAKDNKWYMGFSEHLDLHPEERARLIKGSVEAVRRAFEEQGLGDGAEENGKK